MQKQDVAEVLRRRFFTPGSIADPDSFRPHVTAAVANIAWVDETVRKDRVNAEQRFLDGYPFHPALTDIFYTKWAQLDGFQRTRGILRTFAIALRDAETWDTAPLVGPNVFLHAPGEGSLAEAARELAGTATREVTESAGNVWSAVLEGELAKARAIQEEQPALKCREMEQAVLAAFLSSQPIGQKAHTPELIALVGATRPTASRSRRACAAGRTSPGSWTRRSSRAARRRTADPGHCPRRGASATGRTSSRCTTTPARIASRRSSSSRSSSPRSAGPEAWSRARRRRAPGSIRCPSGRAKSGTTAISISPFWGREPCPTPAGRAAWRAASSTRRPGRTAPARAATPSCSWPRPATVWMPPARASGSISGGKKCGARSATRRRTPCARGCSPPGRSRRESGSRRRSGKPGRSSSPSTRATLSTRSR